MSWASAFHCFQEAARHVEDIRVCVFVFVFCVFVVCFLLCFLVFHNLKNPAALLLECLVEEGVQGAEQLL